MQLINIHYPHQCRSYPGTFRSIGALVEICPCQKNRWSITLQRDRVNQQSWPRLAKNCWYTRVIFIFPANTSSQMKRKTRIRSSGRFVPNSKILKRRKNPSRTRESHHVWSCYDSRLAIAVASKTIRVICWSWCGFCSRHAPFIFRGDGRPDFLTTLMNPRVHSTNRRYVCGWPVTQTLVESAFACRLLWTIVLFAQRNMSALVRDFRDLRRLCKGKTVPRVESNRPTGIDPESPFAPFLLSRICHKPKF